jgi:hypothetical protein
VSRDSSHLDFAQKNGHQHKFLNKACKQAPSPLVFHALRRVVRKTLIKKGCGSYAMSKMR